uniref:Chymotrypsin-elastase inhibitor ixodidin-like n=1 Tax=Diabrotica virgifera virgifera TaxID=50390 RepID=A0A6P7FF52_DIAVI
MSLLLLLVIIFSIEQILGQEDNCNQNEVYEDCQPCCPEQTCRDRLPRPCGSCPNGCTPGCFCKFGYIRESTRGPCVPIRSCYWRAT